MAGWTSYPVTQGFDPPTEWGIDIGTPMGTPITAILPGQVLAEGYHPWGGEIDIAARLPDSGQSVVQYVLHMDRIDPSITPGTWVKRGQLLGTSGGQLSGGYAPVDSSFSTGPHVEYGLFVGSMWSGKAVDPSPYVAQFGAPGQSDPGQLAGAANQQQVPNFLGFPLLPWDMLAAVTQGASNAAGRIAGGAAAAAGAATTPLVGTVGQQIGGSLQGLAQGTQAIGAGVQSFGSGVQAIGGAATQIAPSPQRLFAWGAQNIFPLVVAAIVLLVIFGAGNKKPDDVNLSVINTGQQGRGGRQGTGGASTSDVVVPA